MLPPPFLMKLLIIIHNLVQKKPGILPEKTNKQTKKEVHRKSEVPKNIIICDWLKFSVHCNF